MKFQFERFVFDKTWNIFEYKTYGTQKWDNETSNESVDESMQQSLRSVKLCIQIKELQ